MISSLVEEVVSPLGGYSEGISGLDVVVVVVAVAAAAAAAQSSTSI